MMPLLIEAVACGNVVAAAAPRHLTPVDTLELGGKNPCIVNETADLSMALQRRIAWGK